MVEKIIIAGAGGQGIMLLGKVLAMAAMREGRFVTWLPSYGAEVRGGTSYSIVVISDEEIGSPYVGQADTLIIMNAPSWEKFKNRITPAGLLILNSSLVPAGAGRNRRLLRHPFTDIAVGLGNIRVANMVALGCFLCKKKIVSLKAASGVIADIAPPDKKGLVGINKKALEAGAGLR